MGGGKREGKGQGGGRAKGHRGRDQRVGRGKREQRGKDLLRSLKDSWDIFGIPRGF